MPLQPVYRIEITAPDDTDLAMVLAPGTWQLDADVNEPGTLTVRGLTALVNHFVNEDSDTNPIQLNSAVVIKRANYTGSQPVWANIDPLWQGQTNYIQVDMGDAETLSIDLTADSKLGVLTRTLASINGRSVGTLETPSIDLDAVTLKRVENSGLPEYAYFPITTSDAWLPTSFTGISTTLSANITDSVTKIAVQTTHSGFSPVGIIKIGTEWIYYDGYQDDGTAGVYQFHNCTRGILGTTAASHSAADTVDQIVPARMSPRRDFYMEKQITSGSAWIPAGDAFLPADQSGYFAFDYDILGFDGDEGPFNADPRMTYAVYEEDSADAVTAGSVIRSLLEETKARGGPGWVENTDFTISADLDALALVRFQVDEPLSTWDAILQVFDDVGLRLGSIDDAVVAAEDHVNNKIDFALASQKTDATAADVTVGGTLARRDTRTMENIYSRVTAYFTDIRPPNLLAPERSWHPALNDTIGANSEQVKKIIWRDQPNNAEKADRGFGWLQEDATSSNQQRVERAFDDDPDTSWGLQTTDGDSPGADADILVAWFPDTDADDQPEYFPVGRVLFDLDLGWTNENTDPVNVEILGLVGDGIDVTTDPPTYTSDNIQRISGVLEARYRNKPVSHGNMRRFQEVVMEVEAGISLRGIIVRYQGMPTRDFNNTERRTAAVTRARVEELRTKTVSCQTTASANQSSAYIYAPLSHAKLRGASDELPPRNVNINVGPNTEQGALSLARLLLYNSLLLANDHEVTCTMANALPSLGIDTVEVADAGAFSSTTGQFSNAVLRGIAVHMTLTVDADMGEVMTLILRDYQGGLIQ